MYLLSRESVNERLDSMFEKEEYGKYTLYYSYYDGWKFVAGIVTKSRTIYSMVENIGNENHILHLVSTGDENTVKFKVNPLDLWIIPDITEMNITKNNVFVNSNMVIKEFPLCYILIMYGARGILAPIAGGDIFDAVVEAGELIGAYPFTPLAEIT